MTLEHFNLPRQDWYDVVSTDEKTGQIRGRIYKDRLIENFNAIEAKLNEITKLQPYNTKYPDTSKFIYSDVTLDSETNKVVNLKSFIDILGLKNTPLVVQFRDKRLVRLTYYDSNYKLKNISNIDLSTISNTNPFVIADIENQTITVSGDITEISGKVILGKWNSTTIDSCLDNYSVPLDIYTMLFKSMTPFTKQVFPSDFVTRGGNQFAFYDDTKNNILVSFKGTGSIDNSLIVTDYGTKYNKEKD